MTTAAQLRKAALAQQGSEQVQVEEHRGWAVEGEVFARLGPGGVARLWLATADAARMAAELEAVEQVPEGVSLRLADVGGMALNHWVHQAWRHRAPRSLVEAATSASESAAAGDDDLGPVGAPARRALHGAGLTSLDAVAARRPDDVAALHGVGPLVVGLLRDALAERGVTW